MGTEVGPVRSDYISQFPPALTLLPEWVARKNHRDATDRLVDGPAFPQFCLFDGTATENLSRGFG